MSFSAQSRGAAQARSFPLNPIWRMLGAMTIRPLAFAPFAFVMVGAVLLGGCVSTATHVVMLPVHAASFTADKLTTSHAEADRNYGRKMRKQQAREAKEQRRAEKQQAREARAGN